MLDFNITDLINYWFYVMFPCNCYCDLLIDPVIFFLFASYQIMYSDLYPDGTLKLYHFIIMVTTVLVLLSQLPSFHSLRYISLASLILCLAYTLLVVIGCFRAGLNWIIYIYISLSFISYFLSKIVAKVNISKYILHQVQLKVLFQK